MSALPNDKLAELLTRDQRFWQKAHDLFDRVRQFIAHNLREDEYVGELDHVREALKVLTTFDRYEDGAVLAMHLAHAHSLIQYTTVAAQNLEKALEAAITEPSDATIKNLDAALDAVEKAEAEKLHDLANRLGAAAKSLR